MATASGRGAGSPISKRGATTQSKYKFPEDDSVVESVKVHRGIQTGEPSNTTSLAGGTPVPRRALVRYS